MAARFGVLPVVPFESHPAGEPGDDLPVWHRLARRVVELRVQSQPTFSVAARERLLSPCCRREDYIGDHVGLRPVLERGTERDYPAVFEPRRVVTGAGLVVRRVGGRAYRAERQLGNRVGVLKILVRVSLHSPCGLAVIREDVLGHSGHDVIRNVPRHRRQLAVDPEQRRLEPVSGRRIRVVGLERKGAATDAVIALAVDYIRLRIGLNHNVMTLPVHRDEIVLVRAHPSLERVRGQVHAQGILGRPRPSLCALRPSEHAIPAAHDAVVASCGHHLGVRWRQRHAVLWHVLVGGVCHCCDLSGEESARPAGPRCLRSHR